MYVCQECGEETDYLVDDLYCEPCHDDLRKLLNRKLTKVKERSDMTVAQTQEFKVQAISKEHAQRIAMNLLGISQDRIKHTQVVVKGGMPAKTCKTDDYPVKGTRKWKTEYQIYSYAQRIPIGKDKYFYTELELVAEGFEQKTEAMKAARQYAVDLQLPMTIKIVKVLVNQDNTVCDISPKTNLSEFLIRYV